MEPPTEELDCDDRKSENLNPRAGYLNIEMAKLGLN